MAGEILAFDVQLLVSGKYQPIAGHSGWGPGLLGGSRRDLPGNVSATMLGPQRASSQREYVYACALVIPTFFLTLLVQFATL